MSLSSIKGPAPQHHDGSSLRIAIVHARWNPSIIEPLVVGARAKLLECGVGEENIVIESCPGSWELPVAVQRLYSASRAHASTHSDPTSSLIILDSESASTPASNPTSTKSAAAFDAIIAIGVLIKGETMHFEYIAGSVSDGLMRLQLDMNVPVIFGVLTVLDEGQAKERAGIGAKGHNHGEDWGLAAVEMGVKNREWARSKFA